ncbi:MAG TPA: SpoVR family protein [Rhizomicrobium sp.]|jgi:spore cortex formation protein SpoVR/YcgB (stage V sporulation)|nr:SpoVR family protein [Rhizomicrobium sp.]
MGAAVKQAPLFTESEWDFSILDRTFRAIEDIALNDLKLDVYPNQIEIISSEQMLDAYSSLAMPLMYNHWSFGKHFAREEGMYRAGYSGLAYEVVINSNPCISYCLEENSMTMQALVMAHAAFGHNHFFKNNYLFRQWTNAEGILDYLSFAKKYVAACEEKYGRDEVEAVLDSAHALMDQGVFRYRRPPRPSRERMLEKMRARQDYEEQAYNELWRTLPANIQPPASTPTPDQDEGFGDDLKLPEENLLYFLEKNAPDLKPWQREMLRIVRYMAQYFYPQRQLKVMNEGCATFVHYTIMNMMYDRGLITESSWFEFMHSHTSVIFQPEFDDRRYYGLNPYALGFAMMSDIRRICEAPTEEDRDWFPHLAGTGDYMKALKDGWANYRDESFIEQFLSPKVIRDFRLFGLADKADSGAYKVASIHNENGYRAVRQALSRQYDVGIADPNIQVTGADLKGNRTLYLKHFMHRGVPLHEKTRGSVLAHVERLWGHDVKFDAVPSDA